MLSMLLKLVKQSFKPGWLFISVPVVLGVSIVFIGIGLLPDKPKKFFSDSIPLLELNMATYCAEEKSQIEQYTGKNNNIDNLISYKSKVILSRTGTSEYEMIIDVYGLIGKSENIFSRTSMLSKLFFFKKDIKTLSADLINETPSSVQHYCKKIRLVFNPEDSINIKPSGEFWIKYDEQNNPQNIYLKRSRLAIKPISDFKSLLIREKYADNGFEIELPESNSEELLPEIVGLRFNIECGKCLRGNDQLSDLALSMFLVKRGSSTLMDQMHFLPVHAIANEQYLPTKWDGSTSTNKYEYKEKGFDLLLNTESHASHLLSTWLDNDAERKITSVFTLAGVAIGFGFTLIVEAFVAALYHFFNLSRSRSNN